MFEEAGSPPAKAGVGDKGHEEPDATPLPPSYGQKTTPKHKSPKPPKQYDVPPANPSQRPESSQDQYPHTNPQTPPKAKRQKPQQHHTPDGVTSSRKSATPGTKKHSKLRNVSRSDDEFMPPNDYHLDGTGYHSADAASIPSHVATPARQAYAGPTFHASPAASSLPIPKNFAKSLPADTPKSKLRTQMETDEANQGTQSNSSGQYYHERSVHDSPIDFLLKAHRAQQTFNANDVSTNQRPHSAKEEVRSASSTPRAHETGRSDSLSNREMFMMEVDGTNEDSESEAPFTQTPFHQRISSLQTTPRPSVEQNETQTDEQQRRAKSEALKSLLFSSTDQPTRTLSHPDVSHFGSNQIYSRVNNPSNLVEQRRPTSERAEHARLTHEHPQPIHHHPQFFNQGGNYRVHQSTGVSHPPVQQTHLSNNRHPQRDRNQSFHERQPSPSSSSYVNPAQGSFAPPAETPSRDIGSMEDSLRRLLKLEGSSDGPNSKLGS